jgi:hypothetical protein
MMPGEFAAGEWAYFRVAELYRSWSLLKRLRKIFFAMVIRVEIARLNPSAAGCGLIGESPWKCLKRTHSSAGFASG